VRPRRNFLFTIGSGKRRNFDVLKIEEAQVSTSACIFVETSETEHIGVYCHYDGYPSAKVEELLRMGYDDVHALVLKSGITGGLRCLRSIDGKPEMLRQETAYYFDPYSGCLFFKEGVEYIYIKQKDGTVKWRARHEPDDGWQTFTNYDDLGAMFSGVDEYEHGAKR